MKTRQAIALSVISALTLATGQEQADTCLSFLIPPRNSIITDKQCSLGVTRSCKPIRRMTIRARYVPADQDTAVIGVLNTRTHPPFIHVWELDTIPNQLYTGIGLDFEIHFADGQTSGLHREGIFLAHHAENLRVLKPIQYIPASYDAAAATRYRLSATPPCSATAAVGWNEKGIHFSIDVRDTIRAGDTTAGSRRVEILLDRKLKRSPYPTDDAMILVLPLRTPPYLVTHAPIFSPEGTFTLNPVARKGVFERTVNERAEGGYTLTCLLPLYLLGGSPPDSIRCNILVKNGPERVVASLTGGGGDNLYAPVRWPSLALLARPAYLSPWFIWAAFFIAGFLLSFSGYLTLQAMTENRPRVIARMRRTRHDPQAFSRIKEAIERSVTDRYLTSAFIAQEVNLPPRQVSGTIRKMTGLSFHDYTMYLRIELVTERLRSSFADEAAIAQSCGFHDTKQMERFFRRFTRMSIAEFRKTRQLKAGQ